MIGNFKKVKKISFHLPNYSSLPITFEDVYVDRFNSIFKGHYLLISVNDISVENVERYQKVTFIKIRSTERFGMGIKASDIVYVDDVPKNELTDDEVKIINYLNKVIDNQNYRELEK